MDFVDFIYIVIERDIFKYDVEEILLNLEFLRKRICFFFLLWVFLNIFGMRGYFLLEYNWYLEKCIFYKFDEFL